MLSKKTQPSPNNRRTPFTNLTNMELGSKRPVSFNNEPYSRQHRINSLLQTSSDLLETKKNHPSTYSYEQVEQNLNKNKCENTKRHESIPSIDVKMKTPSFNNKVESLETNEKENEAKEYLNSCEQAILKLEQNLNEIEINKKNNIKITNLKKEEANKELAKSIKEAEIKYQKQCQEIEEEKEKCFEIITKKYEKLKETLFDLEETKTDIQKHMKVINGLNKNDFRMIMNVYWKKVQKFKPDTEIMPVGSIPLRNPKPNLFSFSKDQVRLVSSPEESPNDSVVNYALHF